MYIPIGSSLLGVIQYCRTYTACDGLVAFLGGSCWHNFGSTVCMYYLVLHWYQVTPGTVPGPGTFYWLLRFMHLYCTSIVGRVSVFDTGVPVLGTRLLASCCCHFAGTLTTWHRAIQILVNSCQVNPGTRSTSSCTVHTHHWHNGMDVILSSWSISPKNPGPCLNIRCNSSPACINLVRRKHKSWDQLECGRYIPVPCTFSESANNFNSGRCRRDQGACRVNIVKILTDCQTILHAIRAGEECHLAEAIIFYGSAGTQEFFPAIHSRVVIQETYLLRCRETGVIISVGLILAEPAAKGRHANYSIPIV